MVGVCSCVIVWNREEHLKVVGETDMDFCFDLAVSKQVIFYVNY